MLTAMVPAPTIERLRRIAAANERTLSGEVRHALYAHVAAHEAGDRHHAQEDPCSASA